MSEQLNLPLTVDVPALEADEIVDIYHDDLEAGDVDPEGNAY